MTQSDFAASLEHELQLRRVAFDLADVLEFAASVWAIAQVDPEPVRWADEFLQTTWTKDR